MAPDARVDARITFLISGDDLEEDLQLVETELSILVDIQLVEEGLEYVGVDGFV